MQGHGPLGCDWGKEGQRDIEGLGRYVEVEGVRQLWVTPSNKVSEAGAASEGG